MENEKIKEEQLEEEQKKNPPTRKEIRIFKSDIYCLYIIIATCACTEVPTNGYVSWHSRKVENW